MSTVTKRPITVSGSLDQAFVDSLGYSKWIVEGKSLPDWNPFYNLFHDEFMPPIDMLDHEDTIRGLIKEFMEAKFMKPVIAMCEESKDTSLANVLHNAYAYIARITGNKPVELSGKSIRYIVNTSAIPFIFKLDDSYGKCLSQQEVYEALSGAFADVLLYMKTLDVDVAGKDEFLEVLFRSKKVFSKASSILKTRLGAVEKTVKMFKENGMHLDDKDDVYHALMCTEAAGY